MSRRRRHRLAHRPWAKRAAAWHWFMHASARRGVIHSHYNDPIVLHGIGYYSGYTFLANPIERSPS